MAASDAFAGVDSAMNSAFDVCGDVGGNEIRVDIGQPDGDIMNDGMHTHSSLHSPRSKSIMTADHFKTVRIKPLKQRKQ